jgi:hypothetical protein
MIATKRDVKSLAMTGVCLVVALVAVVIAAMVVGGAGLPGLVRVDKKTDWKIQSARFDAMCAEESAVCEEIKALKGTEEEASKTRQLARIHIEMEQFWIDWYDEYPEAFKPDPITGDRTWEQARARSLRRIAKLEASL